MAGVGFDPEVVHEQADALYRDAASALRNWLLLATTGGFVAGAALGSPWSLLHGGATLVGLGAGFVVGRDRARRARVEAQMLLCQLKVEENTRAWIAQSRLALTKLTAAVDKLPVVDASRVPDAPAPAPAAVAPAPVATTPAPSAPVPTSAPAAPAAAAPAADARPVPARNGPAPVPAAADATPTWAASEQPKTTTLDHLEYLIVTPADEPPKAPVAAEADVEVAWVADDDALDDDAYMQEPVDDEVPEAVEEPVMAAAGGGSPVRPEPGPSKRRRARRR